MIEELHVCTCKDSAMRHTVDGHLRCVDCRGYASDWWSEEDA